MTDLASLQGRVSALEAQYSVILEGQNRIEMLIRTEIKDLKDEQIAAANKAIDRLADDQRRLWERVNVVELRDNRRIGGQKLLSGIAYFCSAGMGGLVTWLATYLSSGPKPH